MTRKSYSTTSEVEEKREAREEAREEEKKERLAEDKAEVKLQEATAEATRAADVISEAAAARKEIEDIKKEINLLNNAILDLATHTGGTHIVKLERR